MHDRLFNKLAEFQLILDIAWGKQRLARVCQAADIPRAVDNFEMGILVQIACVARVNPSIIHRFRRGLGVFVVAHEHPWAAVEHFARVANLELDLRHGRAHRIRLDLAIRLHADKDTGLGHAVELFNIDAKRAVKGKDFRANRLASRVG